jgi:hypothetical protein
LTYPVGQASIRYGSSNGSISIEPHAQYWGGGFLASPMLWAPVTELVVGSLAKSSISQCRLSQIKAGSGPRL